MLCHRRDWPVTVSSGPTPSRACLTTIIRAERKTARGSGTSSCSKPGGTATLPETARAQASLVPMGEEHLAATVNWLQDADLRRRLDTVEAPTAEGNRSYWRGRWADDRQ